MKNKQLQQGKSNGSIVASKKRLTTRKPSQQFLFNKSSYALKEEVEEFLMNSRRTIKQELAQAEENAKRFFLTH